MIDDKKINEAANELCDYGSILSSEYRIDGFKKGVKWTINEFLENTWHPYSEEPLKDAELISITCGEYHLRDNEYFKEDYSDWSEFVQLYEVMYWAYKEDLLSRKVINSAKNVHRLSEKHDNDYEELALEVKKEIYNEILKSIWHPASEKPEGYDEWILLHYNVGNYYSLSQVKDFKSWKGFVERAPIDKWLYIDDLFPKEGGEQ